MDRLSVELENCYGIGKFKFDFEFSRNKSNTFLIYAPNGTMKTSFAKTFDGLAKNDSASIPCDRVYKDRVSKYNVLNDDQPILPESILVINAENDTVDGSEKLSSFIASKELKTRHDAIYKDLDVSKKEFIKRLKGVSRSNDCEGEVLETFSESSHDSFFDVIVRASKLLSDKYEKYEFKYNSVFDKADKVKDFLFKNRDEVENYMSGYKKLLSESRFFKDIGEKSFGTIQANEILKSIEDDSFFNAGHKFVLEDGTEVKDSAHLRTIVQHEIDNIVNDNLLKDSFNRVDKALSNNAPLKEFKNVIEKDNLLLIELKDYEGFKQKVWISFLCELKADTEALAHLYLSKKEELEKIINEAKTESALWKHIIDTFNARFFVPFKVMLTNQDDIILKKQKANLEFHYFDNSELSSVKKEKGELLEVLSRGERRAYFILQFLFEIESKKSSQVDQLLVFDDVADSFDYKNKYAIIEYINELHLSDKFKILILTHNFDFYRTISSRLGLNRKSFIAFKDDQRNILLKDGLYRDDIFKSYLRTVKNPKVFISLISFVRNIIDYTDSNHCEDYNILTSCLHVKENFNTVSVGRIFEVYKNRFSKLNETDIEIDLTMSIHEFIFKTADEILSEQNIDGIILENKIILAIASRLKAEQYMITKLPNLDLNSLEYNQTRELTKEYKKEHPNSTNHEIIGRVNLMTPENIHVNSFMYEPLLDMSVLHLIDTYKKALSLN
ncbi:hypothetical protein D7322_08525 [Sphingobacterium puteale]|uniref:Protein CR006 P-loop domain-containing protein n=1 Tax=Sphingobacterium puteale TaxID=2420510 RepID=A0A420W0L3_9SPHI|nr:hypothetical protein [Sphingobacterium puteale]RKO72125.1 hypothetical protein D7322_08525 [Sphingobacterium puteale]